MNVDEMPADPRNPGKHINPATGIWPTAEWTGHCHFGFVRDARFGPGQVIKGTSRDKSRKLRQSPSTTTGPSTTTTSTGGDK